MKGRATRAVYQHCFGNGHHATMFSRSSVIMRPCFLALPVQILSVSWAQLVPSVAVWALRRGELILYLYVVTDDLSSLLPSLSHSFRCLRRVIPLSPHSPSRVASSAFLPRCVLRYPFCLAQVLALFLPVFCLPRLALRRLCFPAVCVASCESPLALCL